MRKLTLHTLIMVCACLAMSLSAQAQVTIGADRAPEATLDVAGNARIVTVEEALGTADIMVWNATTQIVERIALPPGTPPGSIIRWDGTRWVVGPGGGGVTVRQGGGIVINNGNELSLQDCAEGEILVFRAGRWVCGTGGGGFSSICIDSDSILVYDAVNNCLGLRDGTADGDLIIWDADLGRWVIRDGGQLNRKNWLIGGNDDTDLNDPALHFIGTLNDFPFIVRTNNEQRMQVTNDGKVVINRFGNNPAPNSRTASYGTGDEFGVIGYSNGLTEQTFIPGSAGIAGIGNTTGVYGQSNSANTNAAGLYGVALNTAGVTFGVLGVTNSSDDGAIGMLGQAGGNDGFTYGVAGETYSGTESSAGVMGISAANSGKTYGVYGQSNGSEDGSSGLVGLANSTDSQFSTTGVLGVSRNRGAGSVGVSGIADHLRGERTVGVRGANISEGSFTAGVQGISSGTGADNSIYYGVWGMAEKSNTNATGVGVYGRGSTYGVLGESAGTPGTFSLFGQNNIGTPGFKSFHIDHPLDPANKYLTHICPESPEPLNIYSGNIKTDAQGFAVVELPSYFDAINADVRYNLTAVGTFAQAIVIEKAQNNRFKIQTDKPNVEVSWMVMGRRNDAYAKKFTLPAESAKEPQNVGKYLTPALHGQPDTKGIFYNPDVQKLQSPKAVYPAPVQPQKPRGQNLRADDSRK